MAVGNLNCELSGCVAILVGSTSGIGGQVLIQQLTRRFASTGEITSTILFACIDAADSITGYAIPVYGGYLVL